MADIETNLDLSRDNESVPSLEEPSPEANKPEAGAASSPSTAVSQWQSNVKPTESGDAAVQDAQAAQVQPEVPLLSESASMNTIKLAAPMNVSRKITRTVMFNTSSGIPNNAMLFDNGATLNCIHAGAAPRRLRGSATPRCRKRAQVFWAPIESAWRRFARATRVATPSPLRRLEAPLASLGELKRSAYSRRVESIARDRV